MRRLWVVMGVILIAYMTPSVAAVTSPLIQNVRLSTLSNSTRVVFDVGAEPHYKVFTLKNPWRLVLDIQGVSSRFTLPRVAANHPLLRRIRAARHQGGWRVVFDLNKPVLAESFVLPPVTTNHYRLVLDLMPRSAPPALSANTKSKADAKIPIKRAVSTKPLPNYRKIVVVIDPGHGGKDPGATGFWGTREKDVALNIAKFLQIQLNSQPGFVAVLTRKKDVYVSLRSRLKVARSEHADMFISIHADAFNKRSAAGASVYALSEHGATSEAARWLAQSENNAELMGGVSLEDKGNMLRSVLLDLSQTATTTASIDVGSRILNHLKKITRLHRKRVDQASFVVLKSPDIPSVLVETGFLSNPKEEERLRDKWHQRQMAKSIAQGVSDYFKQHPLRNSYYTWLSQRIKAH